MSEQIDNNSHQPTEDVVDDFLQSFGQKCVGFGYFCDQYMREEINLGEITRRLSEATGEGESFFGAHHAMMTPQQVYRYQTMQQTLDSMTTDLIETEIKRNYSVIQEALRKGEYFIVNITFNSIHSSIYMAYSAPGQSHKERDQKLAVLQQQQELAQALMKVLKVIDQKIKPEAFDALEYRKVLKAFQIYIEYFKPVERNDIKAACDDRVLSQFKAMLAYLETHRYFGDRNLAHKQILEQVSVLRGGLPFAHCEVLEALADKVRPLEPDEELDRLYRDALRAEGEANVYSAVVAFNNFIQKHPNQPHVQKYKREIMNSLVSRGYS